MSLQLHHCVTTIASVDLFASMDRECDLAPDDLERFAEVAWFLMDAQTCVRARERAYRGYVRKRDLQSAGRVALALAEDHFHGLARAVGQGWLRRAERDLEASEYRGGRAASSAAFGRRAPRVAARRCVRRVGRAPLERIGTKVLT